MYLEMYSYVIHIHIFISSVRKLWKAKYSHLYEQNDDTTKNHISIQYQIFVLRYLHLRNYRKVIKHHHR